MVFTKPAALVALIFISLSCFAERSSSTHYASYFLAGVSFWQDRLKFVDPSQASEGLTSSVQALTLGYHIKAIKHGWGWLGEAQLLLGQAKSADANSTYFQGHEFAYGATGGLGAYYLLGTPKILLSAQLAALWCHVSRNHPDGYSFSGADRIDPFLKLEFSMPIARQMELVEQIGIPLTSSTDALWMMGLRLN